MHIRTGGIHRSGGRCHRCRPGGLLHVCIVVLQQPKVYLNGCDHWNRSAVLHAGPELPFRNRFEGLLIQAQPERPADFHLLGQAVLVHYKLEDHRSLPLGFSRFFRILRLNFGKHGGRRYAAADTIRAATESAARPWTNTRTFAGPDTAANSTSDAAARSEEHTSELQS